MFSQSSAERASFTPPALPRPPAWICAFTTTGKPSSLPASTASATVYATLPCGTGTPWLARTALPWYSWIFKRLSSGVISERGIVSLPADADVALQDRHGAEGRAPEGAGVDADPPVEPVVELRAREAPAR